MCPGCGSEVAPTLLSCPGCGRLVHVKELTELASRASEATDPGEALGCWRKALELLPPGSVQYQNIQAKIDQLSKQAMHAPVVKKSIGKGAAAGALSIALLLWKFKFIAVFLLTKAKLLLFGLTKASTFLSMFLSFGVYWTVWGWKFALGLVVYIADRLGIHESTVSRATANKYMLTPRGLYELKYFFSSHVQTVQGGTCSATAIQAMIKRLVTGELPDEPLSDSTLADLLLKDGIRVARRTVAKYREALGIPPSHERRAVS
jgi:hypothetical protein